MTETISADAPSKAPNPSFTVFSDQLGALGVPEDCKLGGEYTARLKVNSVSDGENGRSVGFEVVGVQGGAEAPAGEESEEALPAEESTEEDAAETEMLGYQRPKRKAPPFMASAKDLEE